MKKIFNFCILIFISQIGFAQNLDYAAVHLEEASIPSAPSLERNSKDYPAKNSLHLENQYKVYLDNEQSISLYEKLWIENIVRKQVLGFGLLSRTEKGIPMSITVSTDGEIISVTTPMDEFQEALEVLLTDLFLDVTKPDVFELDLLIKQ